jgi:FKBP-type peptidyl-prolyl cis-trans isomerase FkpA
MPFAPVRSRRLVAGVALAASTLALTGCSLGGDTSLPPYTDPATQSYATATGVTIASMTRVNASVYTQDLTVGTGRVIAIGDSLSVYYKGSLVDGYVFGSRARPDSALAVVLDTTQLIKGWVNGIAGMKTGGTRKLVIGPESGYQYTARTDATGTLIIIPSNSVLIFDV